MKRLLLAVLAVIVIAGAGLGVWLVAIPGPTAFAKGATVALADYRAANPTGVPTELASADLVARGEYLTHAADCFACHTAKGGKAYAGGLAFNLPGMGTLYSTNITPDRATGIGNYTDQQFIDAVRRGVRADGQHLYPAMSYAAYTYMTDTDALAIKAYLFSLPPVAAPAVDNKMAFPFNQRWLMAFWNAAYNANAVYRPNPSQSPEWNRGAYLAEALGHCGECHTPRNPAFALDNRDKFAGTITAGWRAYNITPDPTSGLGAWSDTDLATYLSTGHAEGHGGAAGPMGEASDNSLSYLTQPDIHALMVYLRSIPATSGGLPQVTLAPAPASYRQGVTPDANPRGAAIFASACASCHSWTGVSSLSKYATLTGDRAINDPSAMNVAQAVIHGVQRKIDGKAVFMPSFGAAYSNDEIAAVANYVTARFGAEGAALKASDVAKLKDQSE
ncbi:cytochrome c [Acidisphaera sp. L21]|uniref:cytochrome c n=1 Tax=Acidisphaera sp. L21 TaxID=1641851 RepID=UPI00131D6A2D|nr:cytochrome c [Acidisphaera sp. L21]